MEKLVTSNDRGLVRVLVTRLRDEGIKYLVKDESASSMGEITPFVASQHVWIMEPADRARAEVLLEELELTSGPSERGSWTCGACNEELESQFTECWQCGAERSG